MDTFIESLPCRNGNFYQSVFYCTSKSFIIDKIDTVALNGKVFETKNRLNVELELTSDRVETNMAKVAQELTQDI